MLHAVVVGQANVFWDDLGTELDRGIDVDQPRGGERHVNVDHIDALGQDGHGHGHGWIAIGGVVLQVQFGQVLARSNSPHDTTSG